MKTTFSRRLVLGLGMAGAVMIGTAASAETTKLRFASFVGPTNFLNTGILEPWFDQIEQASGGTVEIEFLTGGSAAKPQDVFDAVKSGLVDIGWSGASYNPGRFNASGVTELPLLAASAHEASIAHAALWEQGLLDGYDGVKVLGISATDVAVLHHVAEIGGMSDFEGAKIRAAGNVLSTVLEEIGAVPVGMPITTVAESLAKNVIDGTAADWYSMEGFRLVDVTKSHVNVALGAVPIYVVMNQRKYDALPDEAKAAFDKFSAADFGEFWGSRLTRKSAEVRDTVAAMDGHIMIEPGEDDIARWRAAADAAIAKWVETTPNGAEILARYKDALPAGSAGN